MLRVFRFDHDFEFPKFERSKFIIYENINREEDVDKIIDKQYKNKDNYIDILNSWKFTSNFVVVKKEGVFIHSIYNDEFIKSSYEEVKKCLYGNYDIKSKKFVIYYSCSEDKMNELYKSDKAIKLDLTLEFFEDDEEEFDTPDKRADLVGSIRGNSRRTNIFEIKHAGYYVDYTNKIYFYRYLNYRNKEVSKIEDIPDSEYEFNLMIGEGENPKHLKLIEYLDVELQK